MSWQDVFYMLRCVCLIGSCSIFSNTVTAQKIFDSWEIETFVALQSHDTRLYDLPSAQNIKNNEKDIGTYHLGLSLHRTFNIKQNLVLRGGLGWSRETNTFSRPYDYCYHLEEVVVCPDVLARIDRYHITQLQFPLTINFNPWSKDLKSWSIYGSLLPFVSLSKHIKDHGQTVQMFEFYSLEMVFGLTRQFNRIRVGIGTRFFQIRKVDTVIFKDRLFAGSPSLPVGGITNAIETHNPFKILITVGYSFKGKE